MCILNEILALISVVIGGVVVIVRVARSAYMQARTGAISAPEAIVAVVVAVIVLGGPAFTAHLWCSGRRYLAIVSGSVAAIAPAMHLPRTLVALPPFPPDAFRENMLGIDSETFARWYHDSLLLTLNVVIPFVPVVWMMLRHNPRNTTTRQKL
jgi:hypothetical protein